ncbi:MAG: hypothetical protein IPI35_11900 [Deltaproteobacteria bacterium]|nr:hypothetical protein [Deltaproteobacteria bacterium]
MSMGYADQRFEEGFAIGFERGFERGLANGRRDVTLEVYRLRFKSLTPAHEAVILNAGLDQLDRLMDAVFTMTHPDELLTGQADLSAG